METYEALLLQQAQQKPLVPLLIVEDDRSLLPIFDWIVRDMSPDLAYHWCASVGQARAFLRHNRYKMILADFLLGESGNGLDVFDLNEQGPDPADFVLMSGLDLGRVCRTGAEGPKRLLAKPLDVSEVQMLLSELGTPGGAK